MESISSAVAVFFPGILERIVVSYKACLWFDDISLTTRKAILEGPGENTAVGFCDHMRRS